MMEKYDGSKHYMDKPTLDLDDRDWRIFREDYEIVTKGSMRHPATGKLIRPFRYWKAGSTTRSCARSRRRVRAADGRADAVHPARPRVQGRDRHRQDGPQDAPS